MSEVRMLNARIDAELKKHAQIRAHEKGQTLGEYLTEILTQELNDSGFYDRYRPIPIVKESNGK